MLSPIGTAAALWDADWFVAIRSNPTLALVAVTLVSAAAAALSGCWLAITPRLARRTPLTTRQIITISVAWAAPLLFALPLTSDDVFSYIAVGKLTALGHNPYTTGVSILPDWQSLGVFPKWSTTPTPYGPFLVWIGWLVVTITAPLGYLGAIAGFRVVMVAGLVLCAVLLLAISRRTGADGGTALWAVIANPLTLITCVLAIHNDALVIAGVAGGLLAAHQGRRWRAWAWLTVATGLKPTAAIAFPAAAELAEHRTYTWRRAAIALAAMGSACLGVLAIATALTGASLVEWLQAVTGTPRLSRPLWYVPVQILTGFNILGPEDGVTPGWATIIVTLVGTATMIAAALIALWPMKRHDPSSRVGLAYLVLLAGGTVIWPWYLLLWLVLIAASPHLEKWIPAIHLTAIFFVSQSLSSGFFDRSQLSSTAQDVFSVLPGALGTLWVLGVGARALWRWRRQRVAR